MEKDETEEEIITLKGLMKGHRNIDEEDLLTLVLECKNCGHRDLLKNFTKQNERTGMWKINYSRDMENKMNCLMVKNKDYEEFFFCPKCKSSLVSLDKKFMKNNLSKLM